MKIKDISVKKIFDSRGEPTIEAGITNAAGRNFIAQIPSGKSRGANEAAVFTYAQTKSVIDKTLRKTLRDKTFNSVAQFDKLLLKTDGTDNKSNLGGNLMLGLSISLARGMAHERNIKTWQLLQKEFFGAKKTEKLPYIFSNLINGGAHANNDLDIQEFQVIVKTGRPIEKNVEKLVDFYLALGDVLRKRSGLANLPIGDEAGYSLNFKNNFEPIRILESLIKKSGLKKEFSIGLDAAASNFYCDGSYEFEDKCVERAELLKIYRRYFKNSRLLVSIEDPFSENDYEGFAAIMKDAPGKLIIGDDITTTNPAAINNATRYKLLNAVIIKPNQIGTVTETCEAIIAAHTDGLKCIVSHRSGETGDNFIIELARASNVYGVKIGAPAKERMEKFNELIRIYE